MPTDVYVNTMAFETVTEISNPHMEIIAEALASLMDGLVDVIAATVENGYQVKLYDIDAPEPRVPLLEFATTSPNWNGGYSLPTEVAICLSYRGLTESGDAAGRRRGRIFLGPIGVNSLSTTDGRPDESAVDLIGGAVTDFADVLDGTAVNHCVWSRAADNLYDVTSYWVDNAFDTQRRRGAAPTFKTPVGPV